MKQMAAFVLACLIGLSSTGCGGDKYQPRPLPLTRALDLTSHKIGKVDLIIKDKNRATKVKEILVKIELLLLARLEVQNALKAKAYTDVGTTEEASYAAIEAAFTTLQAERTQIFEQYLNLQLELREHLTEPEFKRLNAVR